MVSVLPLLVGHVLATRHLVPGQAVLLDAWSARDLLDLATLASWWAEAWPALLATVVFGPLLWVPTLLWNDVADLPGDRLNPRKARSPLVRGEVSVQWANRMAWAGAATTMAAAWAVGPTFAALAGVNLGLAWAYGAPPLRLKTVPGADLAVNAVGVGLVSAVAGWSIVAPVAGFPWPFAWQGLLVAVAVYVPTTLMDLDADAAAGFDTLATHLGPRRAYRIGWWAWLGANAGAIGLAAFDHLIDRDLLPVVAVFAPLLAWLYHRLIGGARTQHQVMEGIIVCSLVFAAVNALWALHYTGLWSP